jgi:hypothetical protein
MRSSQGPPGRSQQGCLTLEGVPQSQALRGTGVPTVAWGRGHHGATCHKASGRGALAGRHLFWGQ